MSELTPPDRARCQADVPTGHGWGILADTTCHENN